MIETAEYGPFWDGYVAAVDRTLIGRRGFSEDSRDCGVDPTSGAIVARGGSTTQFDAPGARVGLLEAKWSARVRQLLQFESDSFVDGEPNIAHLWGNRTTHEGQLGWRSSNGSDLNQYIGRSYGTFHRSKSNQGVWNFMMIPLLTEHSTQIFTRCKDALSRRVLFGGSRKVLRVGKGLLAPNRRGTPLWWNGRFNDTNAAGTEKEYYRPLGPMPPVFPIRRIGVPGASPATGTWLGADRAFWAVVYEFENGDKSAPYLCQQNEAITVNAAGAANKYDYVELFVPPGPPDCTKRHICRTNKWDSVAATPTPGDPQALLYSSLIENNFQTTYRDYIGDNASLRERPDIIRWDLIMPPRASTCWTMDGRVVFGDLAPSLAVIELAPYYADAVALDGYMYDQLGAYGSHWSYFRIDGTNLTLRHNLGPGFAPATVDLTVALAALTLQGLVDTINAVATTAGLFPWRAQLLPGADRNALASDLQTTDAADYFDDDSNANLGVGNCRVIVGHTLPGVLYMKPTSTYATQYTDRRGVHFTLANPAATGTEADPPLGPHAWKGGYDCRRRAEGGMGRIVGGASLLDGSLVFLTNGVAVLRNVRGGKTGVDSDYRMEKWKVGSGVIGPDAFAEGDGWGVYAERGGIMVNDGKEEVSISPRVWNPNARAGAGMGPWAYEFGQSKGWMAKDDDSSHLHLSVGRGRIYVMYRSSASVTFPDMYMYYDFSASVKRIGVNQVLREDGQPYAWSAPCRVPVSAAAMVTRNDGDHMFGAIDDSGAGESAADGAVLEFDISGTSADDGATDSMLAYLQTDRFEVVRQKKRVSKVDVEYYEPNGGVLSVQGATDFARATATAIATLAAVTDGTISDAGRLRLPSGLRGPCEQFELLFTGAPSGRTEVRRVLVPYRVLNTLAP